MGVVLSRAQPGAGVFVLTFVQGPCFLLFGGGDNLFFDLQGEIGAGPGVCPDSTITETISRGLSFEGTIYAAKGRLGDA